MPQARASTFLWNVRSCAIAGWDRGADLGGMTTLVLPASVAGAVGPSDRLDAVVVAFLARYRGQTRVHTASDLRCYLAWCVGQQDQPGGLSTSGFENMGQAVLVCTSIASREAGGALKSHWLAACASAEGVWRPTIAGASWTSSSFSRAATMNRAKSTRRVMLLSRMGSPTCRLHTGRP